MRWVVLGVVLAWAFGSVACKKKGDEQAPATSGTPAEPQAATPSPATPAAQPTTEPAAEPAAAPAPEPKPAAAEPTSEAPAAATGETAVDYSAGQSSGQQTERIEGQPAALVDRELGAKVTCPTDRTWSCKLASDGKWKIQDMSSNTFQIRLATGASDAAAALERELGYVRATWPVESEVSRTEDTVVLAVAADPNWARPVARRVWLRVKSVGDKWFSCIGAGSESNFENASGNYAEMCNSLTTAP